MRQGTDQQQFCYDEQDRLTWAGSTGTPPCTGTAITSGTLPASAQYSANYSYDTLNRLTSSPVGTYTYGDSAHLDAATSVGSGYTASYDASGNMTCRAPTGTNICTGSSPTGQQLSYDNEGRLTGWQDAPSSPSSSTSYLYDGEGSRILAQSTNNGTTTTTTYLGDLEEITATGSTTTTTVYYPGGFAESVNGVISYLASGGLGSPSVALDANGTSQASTLYGPYGGVRYQSGTMPTDLGFTGQHSDASSSGLDYYGARYYDPVIGQFASADTMLAGGLNRYAYVGGNPETLSDPSGHTTCVPTECGSTTTAGGVELPPPVPEVGDDPGSNGGGAAAPTDPGTQVTAGGSDGGDEGGGEGTSGGTPPVMSRSLLSLLLGAVVVGVVVGIAALAVNQSSHHGAGHQGVLPTTPPTLDGDTQDCEYYGTCGLIPSINLGTPGYSPHPVPVSHKGGGGPGGQGGNNPSPTGSRNNITPAPKSTNPQGQYTNGTYTIKESGMKRHMPGANATGANGLPESEFLPGVDARDIVLDAAQYADANSSLWYAGGSKAKVPFTGPVGVVGVSRQVTNYVTITRDAKNRVHGWPSQP